MRNLAKIAWIAVTPVCLTLLLSAPAARAHQAAPTGAVEQPAPSPTAGAQDVIKDPITNFWTLWAYKHESLTGGPLRSGEEPMPGPFVGMLLNFGIFAFLLGKFALPSFTRFTRERHDRIADQLAESARLRAEAQKALDEYTQRLDHLDKEIAALTSEIRAEAELDKKRIVAEAEERAERMKQEAQQQIKAEMQRVRLKIEREAAMTAVATAERLLRDQLSDSDQKVLLDRFVTDLQASKGAVS